MIGEMPYDVGIRCFISGLNSVVGHILTITPGRIAVRSVIVQRYAGMGAFNIHQGLAACFSGGQPKNDMVA